MSSRESIHAAVAAALVAAAGACRIANTPNAAQHASTSVGRRASVDELEQRNGDVIASLDPCAIWAGHYAGHFGVDSNEELELAPRASFVLYTEGLHTGPRAFGSVRFDRDRIRFYFAESAPTTADWFYSDGLVPVRWGDRRYLLRPLELSAFCNSVNAGIEADHASREFFIDRRECPVSGLPELPAAFAERMLAAPLTTRVAQVIDEPAPDTEARWSGWMRTRVQLDAGSRDGVREWMELLVIEPEMSAWVELTRIDEDRSEAVVRFASSDGSTPWNGAILSTRKPRERRHAQNSN